MPTKSKNNRIHQLYLFTIITKGIHGILEVIAGISLLFVKSDFIVKNIKIIFQHEILEDPSDFIANLLINASEKISISTLEFSAIYMICYGCINLGLFLGLWKKKTWAYPLAGTIIILLICYQILRIINNHSIILFILTIINIFILLVIKYEYKRIKSLSKH